MKKLAMLLAFVFIVLFCSCAKPISDLAVSAAPEAPSYSALTDEQPIAPSGSGSPELSTPSIDGLFSGITDASHDMTSAVLIEENSNPDSDNTAFSTGSEAFCQPPLVPKHEFSLPEDFYTRLDEIYERYELNQNCQNVLDGQSQCGCVPEFEKLDANGNVITPRDRVLSLYFCDIESGFELMVNESAHYPVASTIKIPYCVYIYEKIENGEIDPELILTYEKRHYFKGTGVIIKGDFGQQYSVLELLKLCITESDNVAFEMLKDLSPWEDFSEYLLDKGMSHVEDMRKSKQKICAQSAGVDGKVLADFLRSDSRYVETFKSDLLMTKNKMIRSHYPFYRKYGWTNFAFHDIAYVEAPHPYILAVLSNLGGDDKQDYALFKEISYLFEEYSDLVYSTAADDDLL